MNASQTEPALSTSPIASQQHAVPHETLGQQADRFNLQLSAGNLTGLRQFLARTREARDWQERIFMLELVAPEIPLDVLENACAVEPDAADLAVVRCAFYSVQTLAFRCDNFEQASATTVRKAAACVRDAMTSLEAAAKLDPADPTPFVSIMGALGIFDQLKPVLQHAFHQATAIAPELTTFLSGRQSALASPAGPGVRPN